MTYTKDMETEHHTATNHTERPANMIDATIANITFGIELETTIPHAAPVCVGAYHHGAAVTAAPTFNGRAWLAMRDSSIHATVAGHRPCEFVSPVLKGEEGVAHLIEFVEWLNSIGARVNASCGLHIHLGVNSIPTTDRAGWLDRFASLCHQQGLALYAQTGTRRDLGHWCAALDNGDWDRVRAARQSGRASDMINHNRYKLLNLQNLNSRGTVELRCFAGTTNIVKILHHLGCVLGLASFAAKASRVKWNAGLRQHAGAGDGERRLRQLWKKLGWDPRAKAHFGLSAAMVDRLAALKAEALRLARKFDASLAG